MCVYCIHIYIYVYIYNGVYWYLPDRVNVYFRLCSSTNFNCLIGIWSLAPAAPVRCLRLFWHFCQPVFCSFINVQALYQPGSTNMAISLLPWGDIMGCPVISYMICMCVYYIYMMCIYIYMIVYTYIYIYI